jgi:hypothetical protein
MRTRSYFVIALSVCAIASALSGCDWAQFRYGPEHLGVSLDGSISAATVGTLQLAWTAPPSDAFHHFDGSPAVVGGAVYIADDGAALAFDAVGVQQCSGQPKTCQPIKSQSEVMGAGDTSPAVAGDLVYFGSDVGDLYAWEPGCVSGCGYNWLGSVQSTRVLAPPTVANGVAYASSDEKLFAFDAIESPTRCNTDLDICPPLWSAALDNQPGPAAVVGGQGVRRRRPHRLFGHTDGVHTVVHHDRRGAFRRRRRRALRVLLAVA